MGLETVMHCLVGHCKDLAYGKSCKGSAALSLRGAGPRLYCPAGVHLHFALLISKGYHEACNQGSSGWQQLISG